MTAETALTIRGGTALVGPDLEVLPAGEILIRGRAIESVGERGAGSDGAVIDAEGCFVVPGLTDAHVHMDLEAGADVVAGWHATPEEREQVIFRNGLRALVNGITSVRDLGSSDHSTLRYSALVADGRVAGPRVAACGRMIMRPGGHAWEAGRVADGPDELREAVREQIDAGCRLVKVMASGGFSTPGDVNKAELSLDELRAVVEVAHGASTPVAAHAHATEAIASCIAAGIDTIEHGAFLERSQAEQMAAEGIPLVPTLRAIDVVSGDCGLAVDLVERVDSARDRYESSIREAIEAGVPIAAGTDAGTPLNRHGALVDELERYVGLGMQPKDALRAATSRAARLVAPRAGVIEPGATADLLVAEADPREDVGALRKLRHVVSGGRVIDLEWMRSVLGDPSEANAIEERRKAV